MDSCSFSNSLFVYIIPGLFFGLLIFYGIGSWDCEEFPENVDVDDVKKWGKTSRK